MGNKEQEQAKPATKQPWTVNEDGSVKVPLKRAIETHAGKVDALVIREPSAETYFRYGPPFDTLAQMDERDEVVNVRTLVKADIVAKYLAACTDHDGEVLGQMTAFDAARAGNALVSVFFNEAGN